MSRSSFSAELALLTFREQLRVAAARRAHARRRRRAAAALAFVLLVFTGGAFAADRLLFSQHDLTPPDIERQATVVLNDRWLDCSGGRCKPERGTHREVVIMPSMGVTFVLPDGSSVGIVPAFGLLPLPTHLDATRAQFGLPGMDAAGHRTQGTVQIDPTGGSWTSTLPSGAQRIVRWVRATGSLTVTDRLSNGEQTTTAYHPGDVVPFIPDSIDPAARTPEKAVTFDLPNGTQVLIFPTFNETYVGGVPIGATTPPANPAVPALGLDPSYGERYGLTPTTKGLLLPVSSDGGEWHVSLPDGTKRTITWRRGDESVLVTDDRPDGVEHSVVVPIGHELPLIPFR